MAVEDDAGVTSNVVDTLGLLEVARADVQALTTAIHEALRPPSGPHALFHHLSHLFERVGDVRSITLRLGRARRVLKEVFERQDREALQGAAPSVELYQQHEELVAQLKLDFESLYIFSNMMLDQLAHVVAYCIGADQPEKWNFRCLTMMVQARDPGPLAEFAERNLQDVLWLFYQIRFYRNVFVEHVRRPWQRSQTMSVAGEDFSFFTPTPPGWLSTTDQREALERALAIGSPAVERLPKGSWERTNPARHLEIAFHHIDEIQRQSDREALWEVWSKIGGSTPSFHVIAQRLAGFMVSAITTLAEIVKDKPDGVEVGPGGALDALRELEERFDNPNAAPA